METICCSCCGNYVGEDEFDGPFCNEGVYGDDENELVLEEMQDDLYEAYGKVRRLQSENSRLRKKLQKLLSPKPKKIARKK